MIYSILSFFFILGCIIGSFINVVIYRLHENKPGIVTGRSYCPHCKKEILARDLIPVISFLLLRGKCRFCHTKISWKYPVVELVTGLVFTYMTWIVVVQSEPDPVRLILFLCYAFVLVVIFFYDLYYYQIPDHIMFPGIILALLASIIATITTPFAPHILDALLGALIGLVFFGLQVWISRETWMGMGDVFLGIFMGLVLGWKLMLVAVFIFAYPIGAVVGVYLMATAKKGLKSQVPFGPFLVLGMLLALGFGNDIIQWYSGLLS